MSEEFSGLKYVLMAQQRTDSQPYVIAVFGANSMTVKKGELEQIARQLERDNRLYKIEIVEVKEPEMLDESQTKPKEPIEIILNDADIEIEHAPTIKKPVGKKSETKVIN
jgi:hypothetical protein